MMVLIDAKEEEHIDGLDIVDAHDFMDMDTIELLYILDRIITKGHLLYICHHQMYKVKQHSCIIDYHHIVDYHSRT